METEDHTSTGPESLRGALLGGGSTKGCPCSPQPSRPRPPAHGALVENACSPGLQLDHIPPSHCPVQPQAMTNPPRPVQAAHCRPGGLRGPLRTIPKHSVVQVAPTTDPEGLPRALPPPTEGLAGGVTLACQRQGAGSEDVPEVQGAHRTSQHKDPHVPATTTGFIEAVTTSKRATNWGPSHCLAWCLNRGTACHAVVAP